MSKGFAVGKTCRTDMPVHNTLGLMGSGLVASALIVKNAWHIFGSFLSHFFELGIFEAWYVCLCALALLILSIFSTSL